jgi:hypothetical protein
MNFQFTVKFLKIKKEMPDISDNNAFCLEVKSQTNVDE